MFFSYNFPFPINNFGIFHSDQYSAKYKVKQSETCFKLFLINIILFIFKIIIMFSDFFL